MNSHEKGHYEHQDPPDFRELMDTCHAVVEALQARQDPGKRLLYDEGYLSGQEQRMISALGEFGAANPDLSKEKMEQLRDILLKVKKLTDNMNVTSRVTQLIDSLDNRILK